MSSASSFPHPLPYKHPPNLENLVLLSNLNHLPINIIAMAPKNSVFSKLKKQVANSSSSARPRPGSAADQLKKKNFEARTGIKRTFDEVDEVGEDDKDYDEDEEDEAPRAFVPKRLKAAAKVSSIHHLIPRTHLVVLEGHLVDKFLLSSWGCWFPHPIPNGRFRCSRGRSRMEINLNLLGMTVCTCH
jgi:hypothetical protein